MKNNNKGNLGLVQEWYRLDKLFIKQKKKIFTLHFVPRWGIRKWRGTLVITIFKLRMGCSNEEKLCGMHFQKIQGHPLQNNYQMSTVEAYSAKYFKFLSI